MPPAKGEREGSEKLPATSEGSGPQFMSYCVDEGDAKAEMPYAEGNLGWLEIEETISLFEGLLELKSSQTVEAKPAGHGSFAVSFYYQFPYEFLYDLLVEKQSSKST